MEYALVLGGFLLRGFCSTNGIMALIYHNPSGTNMCW